MYSLFILALLFVPPIVIAWPIGLAVLLAALETVKSYPLTSNTFVFYTGVSFAACAVGLLAQAARRE